MLKTARWWMTVLAGLLALQGLSWMFMGSLEPTGWYDSLLAGSQLGQDVLPADAVATMRFVLVPFGATDAAYFVLVAGIAWFGVRETWAWAAVTGSFALWWIADTGGCIWLGAWFNIGIVNLPCLLLVAPALVFWRWAQRREGPAEPVRR